MSVRVEFFNLCYNSQIVLTNLVLQSIDLGVQMNVTFHYQDVVEVVRGGVSELAGPVTVVQQNSNHDLKKKDSKVLFLIHPCVDLEIYEKIVLAEMACQVWSTLEKTYGGDDKLKKVRLQ